MESSQPLKIAGRSIKLNRRQARNLVKQIAAICGLQQPITLQIASEHLKSKSLGRYELAELVHFAELQANEQ
jgi:hypothetical protein